MTSVIKGKIPEYAILLQDSEIPFDVTFQVVVAEGNTVTEKGLDKGVKKVKGEIKAHKYILAASSSVFKGMFFGPMKESKDVIDVKETTVEAFKKLIEYIYQVDIECRDISLVELYDIVNLAELYNIPKLTEELKIQMENIPLSMDNLMDVATIASEYSQFEEVSNCVMMSCAKFLQKMIRYPADRLEFALTQYASGNGEVALKLLTLVKQVVPLVECGNCMGKPCVKGQGVPYDRMRSGLKMKMLEYYPKVLNFGNCHARNTDVTVHSLSPSGQVTVTGYKANHGQLNFTYNPAWEDNGVLKMTFVYNC